MLWNCWNWWQSTEQQHNSVGLNVSQEGPDAHACRQSEANSRVSHGHKFNMNTHSKTSAPALCDLNITLHNPSEKKRGLMGIIEQEINWKESWAHERYGSESGHKRRVTEHGGAKRLNKKTNIKSVNKNMMKEVCRVEVKGGGYLRQSGVQWSQRRGLARAGDAVTATHRTRLSFVSSTSLGWRKLCLPEHLLHLSTLHIPINAFMSLHFHSHAWGHLKYDRNKAAV